MFHQKKLFQKQTLRTAAALLPIGLFMTTSPRDYFITNNAANPTPNNNALSSTSSSSNSSTGSNNSTNTPLKPNPLLHESTTTISTTISVEKEVSTRPLSPIRNLVNLAHCDAQSVATPKIYSYTYPANSPTEDRHIYGSGQNWSYAGVFDGHGGWQIAEMASKQLIHQVLSRLEAKVGTLKDEVSIEKAISESFNEMEKKIVETIRPSFQLGFGEVAKVGSCVLLALRNENHLVVANCGDCRAILGSATDANSKHYSTRINHDHNCREPLEQILLQEKHPNEPNLVVCKNSHACYVKGRLQLTRSLGDAYLKYAEFNGSPSMGRSA
jgi:serine/threonine protein phosphatase PrpC